MKAIDLKSVSMIPGLIMGVCLHLVPLPVQGAGQPEIAITNLAGTTTFIAGDNIALGATASGGSGVAMVEFHANGQLFGTDTNAPYAATLSNARVGGYTLTAVVEDIGGERATSAPVHITVTLDPQRVTLVQNRACWHYWDRGVEPAGDWRLPGFEDHSWKVGFAELGYGDGDEADVVSFGPDPDHKYVTTYFRHAFNLVNHGDYTNLVLRLKRDDGAVVYLNGTEVFRDNLPAGPVTYSTLATNAADDGAGYLTANINPLGLLEDENVIAVEVHQTSTNSSDLSFDLQLLGETGWMPPPLAVAPASGGAVTLSWPAWAPTNFILQARAAFGGSNGWTTLAAPTGSAEDRQFVTVPGLLPAQFYRLCASGTGPASCQPPLVIDQPLAIAAAVGSNIVLSIEAVGAPALTYHWRRNEVFLPGATGSTLVLENAQVADGGTYDVLVGNACGCAPSCPILVTVGASPVTLANSFAARLQTNSSAGTVTGSNAFATREPGEPHNPAREFDHTVWLEWTAPDSGVAVVSTEGSGQDTALAVYTGNDLSSLNLEASAGPTGRARTSSVTFNAVAGTAYQIATDGNGFSPLMTLSWQLTPALACVPQIVVPPVAQVVAAGSNATFSVVAPSCPGDPTTYQWFQGGSVLIPGATNATLVVTNVQPATAAEYGVLVMNSSGSTRSGGVPIIVVSSGSISIPREQFIKGSYCGGKFTNMLVLCYKSANTTITECSKGDYPFMFPDVTQVQPLPSSLSLTINTLDMANSGLDTALRLSTHNNGVTCSAPACSDATVTYACSKLSQRTISFGTCNTASSCVLVTVFLKTTTTYGSCTAGQIQPVIVNHLYQ